MQAESGIVPDFEVGEEFHEEPKTYYELKSQPLKSRLSGVYEGDEENNVEVEVWTSACKGISKCHLNISLQMQNSRAGEVLSSIIWVKCGILGGLKLLLE
ncbi:hypothetical protein Q9233_006891 [Columba guinea]|nr:hypothetical protein Q9233_006891 [Columba guinea]